MPDLNTANFTLDYGTTKRSLGDRLTELFFSVKDFGAIGNGTDDDTEAIQLAFDTAYGPEEDPHGAWHLSVNDGGATSFGNKPAVIFPPGEYMVSSTLKLNVASFYIIGAGSHQTRIFYDPMAAEHTTPDGYSGGSAVLEARYCWSTHMEGITLDASNVQDNAFRSLHWPALDDPEAEPPTRYGDDGSSGYYRDVHFTNGLTGFMIFDGKGFMGSERIFVRCKFTNNSNYGHRIVGQNALNHHFYGCVFANNEVGASTNAAGASTFRTCRFENNALIDADTGAMMSQFIGCSSNSVNFVQNDGVVIGCTHTNGTEGIFVTNTAGIGGLVSGGNACSQIVLIGNHSTNGKILQTGTQPFWRTHLTGNVFDNVDYLADFDDDNVLWEDGVQVYPP